VLLWREQAAELERCLDYLSMFAGPTPDKAGAAIRAVTQDDLQDVFNSMDVDQSGCLSMDEIGAAARQLGFQLKPHEIKAAAQEMDVNQDGRITFDEFAEWWNSESNNQRIADFRGEMAATPEKLKGAPGAMFG